MPERKNKAKLIDFVCAFCGAAGSRRRVRNPDRSCCDKNCARKLNTLVRKRPLETRFWAKIDKTPGQGPDGTCWVWTAGTTSFGYGYISRRGAHCVSWEIHNNPIPKGICVLHRCDNPPCVNPAHLFLGTKKDNAQDAVAKGRWTQAKGNHRILSISQVREIRARYRPRTVGYEKLGREFGVSAGAINHIIHRRTWAETE